MNRPFRIDLVRPFSSALALGLTGALALGGPAASAALQAGGTTTGAGVTATQHFVRAGEGGATLRNYPDVQGLSVRRVPAGTLMQVHAEEVGFQRVAVAGGVKIWVFGEFLDPTHETRILRCNSDGVNMRPQPSSGVHSLPLPHKLRRGELLKLIARHDPSVALAEDWVQVWSPADAHSFVQVKETVAVTDAAAAAAEWARAAQPIQLSAATTPAASSGTGSSPEQEAGEAGASTGAPIAKSEDVNIALKNADDLFQAAKAQQASFADAATAYKRVLELAPAGSPTAKYADRRLVEANLNYDVARLEAEVEANAAAERERIREAQERLEQEREQRELQRTTHWGRFNARGWVERQTVGKEHHYYVNWGGEIIAEIASTSGRFDLAVFENCEVGVIGDDLRAAIQASMNGPAMPRVIDVYRIEVLSVRAD